MSGSSISPAEASRQVFFHGKPKGRPCVVRRCGDRPRQQHNRKENGGKRRTVRRTGTGGGWDGAIGSWETASPRTRRFDGGRRLAPRQQRHRCARLAPARSIAPIVRALYRMAIRRVGTSNDIAAKDTGEIANVSKAPNARTIRKRQARRGLRCLSARRSVANAAGDFGAWALRTFALPLPIC